MNMEVTSLSETLITISKPTCPHFPERFIFTYMRTCQNLVDFNFNLSLFNVALTFPETHINFYRGCQGSGRRNMFSPAINNVPYLRRTWARRPEHDVDHIISFLSYVSNASCTTPSWLCHSNNQFLGVGKNTVCLHSGCLKWIIEICVQVFDHAPTLFMCSNNLECRSR